VSTPELVPRPEHGRVFTASRRVHLGDVTTDGRLRLDALARHVQDIAGDDADDAGLVEPWVLRRMAVRIDRFPRYREAVELATWCSGIGTTAAERRTSLSIAGSVAVEAAALWVQIDAAGRPARLGQWFTDRYGRSAGGRRVASKLTQPPPPPDLAVRPWPLREADYDVLVHVNNAVSWAALEDELARRARGARPRAAVL
jgi:acyl-ACP thioesterase